MCMRADAKGGESLGQGKDPMSSEVATTLAEKYIYIHELDLDMDTRFNRRPSRCFENQNQGYKKSTQPNSHNNDNQKEDIRNTEWKPEEEEDGRQSERLLLLQMQWLGSHGL